MPDDKPEDDRTPEAGKPEGTPAGPLRQDKPSRFARYIGHASSDMTTEELMQLTRGE